MRRETFDRTVRIVLADDHHLVRTGIKALLGRIGGVEVIAEAKDGAELLALVDGLRPDLVITDLSMPGFDGADAIAAIHGRHPDIPILVLSMHDDAEVVRHVVASGASGYIIKGAPPLELEQAVLGVMRKGTYFSPAIARRLRQSAPPAAADVLTHRQLEILKLIAQGHAAKEVAYELGLSSKTVDAHRARIMERLNIKDIAGLTLYAVRQRLVKP